MNRQPYIYIHADDYGMTPISCQRIRNCMEHGCLNSLSVMPNGCLSEKSELKKRIAVPCSIHINLVEGKALTPANQLHLLVRSDGYMKNSFLELLFLSLSSKRKQLERELYQEIKAQIFEAVKFLPSDETIYLDSHQHTHMIPLIFKTILQIVEEGAVARS